MIDAIRRRLTRQDEGATSVEYALMASLIALVIIAAVIVLGTSVSEIFMDAGI